MCGTSNLEYIYGYLILIVTFCYVDSQYSNGAWKIPPPQVPGHLTIRKPDIFPQL